MVLAAAIALVVITLGVSLGWHNNKTIPVNITPELHYTDEPGNRLSFLSNWDGPGYLNVARYGYPSYIQAGLFPFYPMMIYVVHLVVPSPLDSGLLIAWLSFVVAIYFYIKIVRRLYDVKDVPNVLQAVTFFVLFPTAIFYFATYTESLFAMLSLAAIHFAFDRRYLLASFLLLLTTATHITGVFVVVFVALILLEQKVELRRVIFSIIAGSSGLLAYTFYLFIHLHDAFAFLRSQTQVNEWMQHGFVSLVEKTQYFNAIFVILLIISAFFWWRRRRSFAVYSALFLLIPLLGRQYGGFNRYVLVAFPVQIMLYEFFRSRKAAFPYAAALMAVIWTYFLLQYAGGYIGSGG